MNIISLFMADNLGAQWALHSDLCNEWMNEWMAPCYPVSYLACCRAATSFSEAVPCFGEGGVQIARSLSIPVYCLSVLPWILAAEAPTPVMFHLIKILSDLLVSLASSPSQPLCYCLGEFDLKRFQSVQEQGFDIDMEGCHEAISKGGKMPPNQMIK